jgi:hypothetical protein
MSTPHTITLVDFDDKRGPVVIQCNVIPPSGPNVRLHFVDGDEEITGRVMQVDVFLDRIAPNVAITYQRLGVIPGAPKEESDNDA